MFETKAGAVWRQAHVETSQFYTSKDVDKIIEQVEVGSKSIHSQLLILQMTSDLKLYDILEIAGQAIAFIYLSRQRLFS